MGKGLCPGVEFKSQIIKGGIFPPEYGLANFCPQNITGIMYYLHIFKVCSPIPFLR